MADLEAANEDFQPSPPTTPESRVDYNARKAANDNVLQVVASVSSGSNDNTDLNQAELGVQKEAASSSGIHSVSQGVGEATEDGGPSKIDYATMSWWHTGIIMIAETVSLGILSLPKALSTMGFVPGVLIIVLLGILSWYTGYVTYQVKQRYPAITSFADIFALWLGKPGRWFGEVAQNLLLIFIMAAHIVTFSVMLNVLTEHRLCTIAFMAVGAAVSFLLSTPRTFKANSKASVFSCISIATATLIAMIAIGIEKKGLHTSFAITPSPETSLGSACMSVSSIILAYNGHIAYPSLITEMRQPRDFPKALALLITTMISLYLVVAVVIYYYAGQTVQSPALGSASPLTAKIAYAIAIPTILVAGVIAALVAAKQLYRHLWRRHSHVMREKSLRARASWFAVLAALYLLAWLMAESVPVFQQLLGVIGALFGTWFALGFPALFWFWMWWRGEAGGSGSGKAPEAIRRRSWRTWGLVALNAVIVVMSASICVLGMYGSLKAIVENESDRRPFSCASNV
ncbi:hypothetical protein B0A50_08729 [Salinomyces thailandicus]|uniref:Amino acid transporter transmembrane domain-containing protein n=1 Tax=Salinomyces thailandicus TaxID=706561 RepID=A0A4U0TJD6_9PEZI|nr:hypothetical protein B0A50_08729 [Salinomyces thailandica]